MGDTFTISGLKEKRAAVAGRHVDLRREADRLQADLAAVDAVLRIYEADPSETPNKGRMPVRILCMAFHPSSDRPFECHSLGNEAHDLAWGPRKTNGIGGRYRVHANVHTTKITAARSEK
jgi:hypothetical protein